MNTLADLARRVESLIRLGTVVAVDLETARIRVASGGLTTAWLPWFERRAGTTRDWNPPTVGEQCMVLSPSGDPATGIVLTGLFSNAAPAPNDSGDESTREYPDGARITYNHAGGHLSVTGIQTAVVEASKHVTVDCPNSTFTGNVLIEGKLTVEELLTYRNGLLGFEGGGGHGNVFTGNLTHVGGNLSSNGIVLHTHIHHDSLSGTTGGPVG